MGDSIIQIDLDGVNCYLAKGENGFILFDTGGHLVMDKVFSNRQVQLQNKLEAFGCTKQNLNLIVLTHGDCDHAGNALYLRERYHSKIAMHIADKELVETPSLNKWMESFHYQSLVFKLMFQLMKKTLAKLTQKTLDDFQRFSPDVIINDGFCFAQYGLDATVIHTPGHTKGSIAVLTSNGDLMVGDTFSNNKKPALAMNANDFNELSKSVGMLKTLKAKMVYPGHGKPFAFERL